MPFLDARRFQASDVEQLFFLLDLLRLPFPFLLLALADTGHNPHFACQGNTALDWGVAFFTVDQPILAQILARLWLGLYLKAIQKIKKRCIHKLSPSSYR